MYADDVEIALEDAVTEGNLERLQEIAAQVKDDIKNFFDDELWLLAARQGHLIVMQWMHLQADKFDIPQPEMSTLLNEATKYGQLHIVQWLAEQGCNLYQLTHRNYNALTLAAEGGHLEVVKWLAEQGCNLDQLDDFNGNALPLAAQGGYLEVVK